jgi:hypothetical protein
LAPVVCVEGDGVELEAYAAGEEETREGVAVGHGARRLDS